MREAKPEKNSLMPRRIAVLGLFIGWYPDGLQTVWHAFGNEARRVAWLGCLTRVSVGR